MCSAYHEPVQFRNSETEQQTTPRRGSAESWSLSIDTGGEIRSALSFQYGSWHSNVNSALVCLLLRDQAWKPSSATTKHTVNMTRVFIGGLPEDYSKEDVELLCANHASPDFVSMKKGYAFVSFSTQEEANGIVSALHNTELGDAHLRVELARDPVCYVCNQEGHMARRCPNRQQQQDHQQPVPPPRVPVHTQESLPVSCAPHCNSCTCFESTPYDPHWAKLGYTLVRRHSVQSNGACGPRARGHGQVHQNRRHRSRSPRGQFYR